MTEQTPREPSAEALEAAARGLVLLSASFRKASINTIALMLDAFAARAVAAARDQEVPSIKTVWLKEKPSNAAQGIRATLSLEVDRDEELPDYVWDLTDVAAQRGINHIEAAQRRPVAAEDTKRLVEIRRAVDVDRYSSNPIARGDVKLLLRLLDTKAERAKPSASDLERARNVIHENRDAFVFHGIFGLIPAYAAALVEARREAASAMLETVVAALRKRDQALTESLAETINGAWVSHFGTEWKDADHLASLPLSDTEERGG